MTTTNDPRFQILVHRPHGRPELLDVEPCAVRVGAGAHCDIRLDGGTALHEHAVLAVRAEGIEVRALASGYPVIRQGRPIWHEVVPSGTELFVAGTRIVVELPGVAARGGKRTIARAVTAGLVVLLCLVVPGLVFARMRDGARRGAGGMPAPVALFDDEAPACKAQEGEATTALARRSRTLGLAHRERHPFSVEEGVLAVGALRAAGACFRRQGMDREARESEEEAAQLRATIERDYFVHRVRLEYALDEGDGRAALLELRVLRRMTSHRTGPFVEWLGALERRVEAAARGNKSGAPEGS